MFACESTEIRTVEHIVVLCSITGGTIGSETYLQPSITVHVTELPTKTLIQVIFM